MTFEITQQTGISRRIMEKHLRSKEVLDKKDQFVKFAFLGLGQGGGRIASEFARFGFPTFLFNTSSSDMEEHADIIPQENRILTTSTETNHHFEGTDKNADLGYTIASEEANQMKYATVVMKPEVMNADFVWVTVSLGGGTGNGALPVVIDMLRKARHHKRFTSDKVPFGVICSLPAKDEVGSKIRDNALKGIEELQSLIAEEEIGSVIVIDNEKLNHYYDQDALQKKSNGDYIDAKSYTNIMVSLALLETAAIPLLKGRVVLDMAEYIGTISTPGWLSLSKAKVADGSILEPVIKNMFEENEILADTSGEAIINAAAAILVPASQSIPTNVQDKALQYASINYKARNKAIVKVSNLDDTLLYGMSVSVAPPTRVEELKTEFEEFKAQEQADLEKRSKFNKVSGGSRFNQMTSYNKSNPLYSIEKKNEGAPLSPADLLSNKKPDLDTISTLAKPTISLSDLISKK